MESAFIKACEDLSNDIKRVKVEMEFDSGTTLIQKQGKENAFLKRRKRRGKTQTTYQRRSSCQRQVSHFRRRFARAAYGLQFNAK